MRKLCKSCNLSELNKYNMRKSYTLKVILKSYTFHISCASKVELV